MKILSLGMGQMCADGIRTLVPSKVFLSMWATLNLLDSQDPWQAFEVAKMQNVVIFVPNFGD